METCRHGFTRGSAGAYCDCFSLHSSTTLQHSAVLHRGGGTGGTNAGGAGTSGHSDGHSLKAGGWEERLCDKIDKIFNTHLLNENDIARRMFTEAVASELALAREEVAEKYQELILAVGNRNEGETRHETALRYIRQAEEGSSQAARSHSKGE